MSESVAVAGQIELLQAPGFIRGVSDYGGAPIG